MERSQKDTLLLTISETVQREPYEEPRGKLEQVIAQVWRETFHLDQVGRNDNFFELGGNSLIGMEVMDKVSTKLDLQIPVVILFQNPTPRQLAHSLSSPEYSETPEI